MYTHDTTGMGSGMPKSNAIGIWLPYHLLAKSTDIGNMASACGQVLASLE